MASVNPFDLLVDDDNDDVSQLIAKKASLAPTTAPPQQQPKPQAKLPSKPLPPAQAVKEQRNEGRGGGRGGGGRYGSDREGGRGFGGGGRGRGDREGGGGGRGYNRDRVSNENTFSSNGAPPEEGDVDKSGGRRGGGGGVGGGGFAPRGGYRGGRRGGYNNGEVDGERPRRVYERHSATGRGTEVKREGSGRGNWGSVTDEMAQDNEELVNAETAEKSLTAEKQPGEEVAADAGKENPVADTEEKEPEEKEMTLEEYEKVMEEKRKGLLQGLKVEERKVTVDKEFETMQQLSGKKSNNDVYAKLGSDKDKKKEIADRDEKAKKSVSINEFLKPAEGERFYSPGGRGGRGRGRGGRGGGGGGFSGGQPAVSAPSIEDPGQFPQLK